MPDIGETLREARMRERIDVSEIEATTKIRAKYLRALENEEWDLLPGPTFVKSFLRTYGDALGLDGKALVEDYRKSAEPPSEPLEPIGTASARRARGRPEGPSRGYIALVGIVGVIIVLLIIGLVSKGGKSPTSQTTSTGASRSGSAAAGGAAARDGVHGRRAAPAAGTGGTDTRVSVSLRANGPVYVCLIGEDGRKLVAGETLTAGGRTATFTARRFELTLGNNAVTLLIDGTPRSVPASSSAIGYVITKAGRRTLPAGHLPTCT
jgi:cytoskeleton protein RodZ